MSEETVAPAVDVNSKTSLAGRLGALIAADLGKGAKAYTSVLNWIFIGLAVWQVLGPIYEARGANNANAAVANLEGQLLQAQEASRKWESAAKENKLAYDASAEEAAELRLKLDEAQATKKPEMNKVEPTKATTASMETPIVKAKVRKVPVTKKEEEKTAWDELVASVGDWYAKNKPEGAP